VNLSFSSSAVPRATREIFSILSATDEDGLRRAQFFDAVAGAVAIEISGCWRGVVGRAALSQFFDAVFRRAPFATAQFSGARHHSIFCVTRYRAFRTKCNDA